MRKVMEARRKRPRHRPAAPVEQGEDASDRPSAPDILARLDDLSARHRAEQTPTATTPGSPSADTPGCASRWQRRSPPPRDGRVKAALETGVSEKPGRGPMAEVRLVAHMPRQRRHGSYGDKTTPAPDDLTDHDSTETRNGPRASSGIRAGDGKERVSHRRSTAMTEGSSPTRLVSVPTRSCPTGCSSRRRGHCPRGRDSWCIPTVDATAGGRDG